MPTYEYVCQKCGHQFDKLQRITAKPLTVCPQDLCPRKPWGKGEVKRVVSAGGGLLFKGSGFYTTDYRSEGYKAAAKKEAGAASSTEGAKKESKPADAAKPTAGGSSPPKAPAGDSK
jgi:putative FmdB family regulatory protein